MNLRCNKCHRAITGTTSHDGVCECGGLIEAVPNVVDLAAFLADRVARDARELAAYVHRTARASRRRFYRERTPRGRTEVRITTAQTVVKYEEDAVAPGRRGHSTDTT